ncbi:MAG: HD domain-containing protein [Blastocatellia bacterium]
MHQQVLRICEAVREAGGRALIVGGWVRDRLYGFESKDFDIEVYRLDPARLRAVLESIASVNTVGEHFSVYKLVFQRQVDSAERDADSPYPADQNNERVEIDVSIPRRESKSGRGHRAFVIEGDPSMSFAEAARRRDFTINAVMYDPLTGETIDPYGGKEDFERRVLRAVAPDTFVEDSLRVLRAVQLAARFEMTVEPLTAELCRNIDLSDLPSERVWGEVEKLLLLADHPSIGLQTALELEVLNKLFPELGALGRVGNDPAFTHTALSLDQASKLTRDLSKPERIAVMLATMCHDLGKPIAAELSEPEWNDHAALSVELARSVLKTLGLHTLAGYDARSQALALVREHLRPAQFYESRGEVSDGAFRRLAQVVDLDLLYRVAKACALARGTESPSIAEDWFIERARKLGVEHGPPPPVLLGRHLIEAGHTPGPEMGRVLREVYELQLDGKVTTLEEALASARNRP